MNDAGPPPQLSWDAHREDAPERPRFERSFVPEEAISRPRSVLLAFVFVLIAVLSFAAVTAIAAVQYDGIRGGLAALLAEELQDEYEPEDMQRAVNVLLGSVWVGGLLLSLVQVLSAQSVLLRRSSTARVVLIASIAVFLPVAVVALSLRDGTTLDLVLSAAGGVLLCAAAVLLLLPRVSKWLRQRETPEARPLITRGVD